MYSETIRFDSYRQLIKNDSERFEIINADQSTSDTEDDVIVVLLRHLLGVID